MFYRYEKVFDCVNHYLLRYTPYASWSPWKIPQSCVIDLLPNTLCSQDNNNMTIFCLVLQGIKQGCKLSSILFALYINDLVNDLNALSCGIQFNNNHVYADDIALIANFTHWQARPPNLENFWKN